MGKTLEEKAEHVANAIRTQRKKVGRTPKPLTIVVFSPLDEWPEIVKLEEQGHTIISGLVQQGPIYANPQQIATGIWEMFCKADIILGPRCWYMDHKHRKYLTEALKQARLRRYGGIAKKEPKKDWAKAPADHGPEDDPDPDLVGSTGC